MKRVTAALALVALVAGALAAGTASAHGRWSVGIGFGWPGWYAPYPYYYYPPPYYYSPPVVVREQPVTYIERGDSAPAREARRDWWYFCPETKTYYPYVKECAKGWQKVAPEPPSER